MPVLDMSIAMQDSPSYCLSLAKFIIHVVEPHDYAEWHS